MVYVWLPTTLPEPFDSLTAPAEVVPSPQSHTAVWMSRTSGSVNVALTLTAEFTTDGPPGRLIELMLGAALDTVLSLTKSESPGSEEYAPVPPAT